MSRLPFPIKEVLRQPVADDPSIERVWRRMQAAASPPVAARSTLRSSAFGFFVGAGAATIVALLLIAPDDAPPRERARAPEVLRLSGGEVMSEIEVAAHEAPRARDFEDRSRLIVLPGSRLSALENSAARISFVLERGRAAFEVQPGGPRRWIIECGLATVEVVGTRFSIERSELTLRVSVEEGAVLVRGARVEGGVRRLIGGESIEIGEPNFGSRSGGAVPLIEAGRSRPEAAMTPERSLRRRIDAALAVTPAMPPVVSAPRVSVEPPARAEETPPIVEPAPSTPAVTGIEDATTLLERADQARLRGDHARAAELLEKLLHHRSEDPSAALAAFTLGRIELEHLDRPERAVSAFERALSLQLPVVLRKDALAHLERARARLKK